MSGGAWIGLKSPALQARVDKGVDGVEPHSSTQGESRTLDRLESPMVSILVGNLELLTKSRHGSPGAVGRHHSPGLDPSGQLPNLRLAQALLGRHLQVRILVGHSLDHPTLGSIARLNHGTAIAPGSNRFR